MLRSSGRARATTAMVTRSNILNCYVPFFFLRCSLANSCKRNEMNAPTERFKHSLCMASCIFAYTATYGAPLNIYTVHGNNCVACSWKCLTCCTWLLLLLLAAHNWGTPSSIDIHIWVRVVRNHVMAHEWTYKYTSNEWTAFAVCNMQRTKPKNQIKTSSQSPRSESPRENARRKKNDAEECSKNCSF